MYVGSNQNGVHPWKLILMAITIVIYQNLDNIDGKQARRTGNSIKYLGASSPLGMLFDHGTDAIASFLIAIQILDIMQFESGAIKVMAISTIVMPVYFSAMWSQYSTGNFRLGLINPVD